MFQQMFWYPGLNNTKQCVFSELNAQPRVPKKHYVQLTKGKKKQILNLRYDKLMPVQEISKIVTISEVRILNFLNRNPSFTSVPSPKKAKGASPKKSRLSLSSQTKKASNVNDKNSSIQVYLFISNCSLLVHFYSSIYILRVTVIFVASVFSECFGIYNGQ